MLKTQITINFFVPTTSIARVQDCMTAVKAVVDENRGENFFATMSGPHGSIGTETRGDNGKERSEDRTSGGVGRSRAADDAAAVFDSDGDEPAAEPVKRGRGRPPKARPPEGDGDDKRASRGSGAEGSRGAEPKRTREGSDEGSRSGEGRGGSSGGSRADQRGNREASRVKDDADWGDEDAGGEDWGDEVLAEEGEDFHAKTPGDDWPDHLMPEGEIDKTVITTLLSDHFKASGGKDRALTLDVMERVCETRALGQVEPKEYDKLARALLHDIARYKHGVKKPK